MSKEKESIKAKIRALAAKSVANGCTEEEAMSAMAAVGRLLEKYNLSMDEVEMAKEEMIKNSINSGSRRERPVVRCLMSLARFCEVKVWMQPGGNGNNEFIFFGQESDVMMAEYLYNIIDSAIQNETNKFKKTDTYLNPPPRISRRTVGDLFQKGMAARISQRLNEMAAERSKTEKFSDGRAIVIIKNQLVEQAFKNQINIRLNSAKNSSWRITDQNAYNAGINAGNTVNLSRPVTTSSSGPLLLK